MNQPAENPRAVPGDNAPPTQAEILAQQYAEMLNEVENLAIKATSLPRQVKGEDDLKAASGIVRDARTITKKLDTARDAEGRPHLEAKREIDTFFKAHMERLTRISTVFQSAADAYQREKAAEERRKRDEEARKAREEEARRLEAQRKAEEEGRAHHAALHEDKAEQARARAEDAEAARQTSAADLTRVRTEDGVVSAKTSWAFEITDFAKVDLEVLRPYLARTDIEKAIRAMVRVQRGETRITGVRVYEDVRANIR